MTTLHHNPIVRPHHHHDHHNANPNHESLAVSATDAARLLGICPRLLWTLTKQGHIPHARIGRRVLYPVEALRAWLAKQTQGTPAV